MTKANSHADRACGERIACRPPRSSFSEEPRSLSSLWVLTMVYGMTRQQQVLTGLICRDHSTSELAGRPHITPSSIQDHLKSIFEKTGANRRRDLSRRSCKSSTCRGADPAAPAPGGSSFSQRALILTARSSRIGCCSARYRRGRPASAPPRRASTTAIAHESELNRPGWSGSSWPFNAGVMGIAHETPASSSVVERREAVVGRVGRR